MSYTKKIEQTRFYFSIGDILKEKSDSLVVWTTGDLRRGDELFVRIHKEGGSTIQKDCLSYLIGNSEIPSGQAVTTNAGVLMYKTLFHCVLPLKSNNINKDNAVLATIKSISGMISIHPIPIRSVLISPVPGVLFGDYTDVTVKIFIANLLTLAEKHKLREIRFVAEDPKLFELYLEEFKKQAEPFWSRLLSKLGF